MILDSDLLYLFPDFEFDLKLLEPVWEKSLKSLYFSQAPYLERSNPFVCVFVCIQTLCFICLSFNFYSFKLTVIFNYSLSRSTIVLHFLKSQRTPGEPSEHLRILNWKNTQSSATIRGCWLLQDYFIIQWYKLNTHIR